MITFSFFKKYMEKWLKTEKAEKCNKKINFFQLGEDFLGCLTIILYMQRTEFDCWIDKVNYG